MNNVLGGRKHVGVQAGVDSEEFDSGSANIVVVENDMPTVELLDSVLTGAGFTMMSVRDGEIAIELCREKPVDVVVMDLDLPGITGQETCRRIREFSDVYIVMLTNRSDEIDKVVTISLGADDYLTKPFSPRELVSRIHAMMRRPRRDGASKTKPQARPKLVVDEASRQMSTDNELIRLTPTELKLTQTLVDASPRALSRRELIQEVWGPSATNDVHLVDVHISNLRRKLRESGLERCIENDRGIGFRIVVDIERIAASSQHQV